MKTTGYFIEIYYRGKYIGRLESEKDREHIGYRGKQAHTADEDFKVNGKLIRKGEEYHSILYPYNKGKEQR